MKDQRYNLELVGGWSGAWFDAAARNEEAAILSREEDEVEWSRDRAIKVYYASRRPTSSGDASSERARQGLSVSGHRKTGNAR